MIEIQGLTKRYGAKTAVDNITATIRPGLVTGFLGPNGAGKSTTMRAVIGLDLPSSGTVTVNGKRYAEHRSPMHEVGALLDAKAIHTGRTAYNHLLAMAATHGIGKARVHEVIAMTGLESVAKKRVGGFSLGMGQRLGIAAALLGDPQTLILDEPVNGLDPEGVIWVRQLTKYLASQGRTVFLSSHLMSEMAQTADHLIVLGRGRIIADAPVSEILAIATGTAVVVRTPQAQELATVLATVPGTAPGTAPATVPATVPGTAPEGQLTGSDVTVTSTERDLLKVVGLSSAQIGEAAAHAGIVLHELTPIAASLEDAYLELTQDDVEYHSEVSR